MKFKLNITKKENKIYLGLEEGSPCLMYDWGLGYLTIDCKYCPKNLWKQLLDFEGLYWTEEILNKIKSLFPYKYFRLDNGNIIFFNEEIEL
jgi:hypothetical protein